MSSPLQSQAGSPLNHPTTPGCEVRPGALSALNANNNNNNHSKPISQESYCQRRGNNAGKHRHAPYDRSPGGASTCTSSDDSSSEDFPDDTHKVEQHVRKRTAANERERKRMHTVNSAFDQLRELVPTYPTSRKLSKIDTLKLACTYIQDLRALLVSSQMNMQHSEDVISMFHPEGYAAGGSPTPGYPGVHVKAEYAAGGDFSTCNSYQHYRVPHPAYLSDPDFSASEPENHSPPFYAPSSQASGIGTRPLSLSRASSDSVVTLQMQQQQSSVGNHMPVPPYPRHTPTSCSPLATVQHTSAHVPPACSPPIPYSTTYGH